ncbi:N-acetylmannosamine-6-phosphate 2-epimerase [Bacillus sp. HMF5848]|uniref:N-acetylmannosamine-6-phosphate 2-epimerase n=1 Tax=Bacillus sp. HMF5848 TaxID=2495421 RepID=UPI000F79EE3B|nr:N-acetylmannosamine-6-phosphate 2-epimerase [Bacillus sp. HMF5848]RSK28877.1 N-acetylmannosamine-6-phosphate 2-epimerase [Bacillus sp. HMF5848]
MDYTTFNFKDVQGSLIVSCQALEDEPLHGADIMAKMAVAAEMGGARAIRANSKQDIIAIKQAVKLPVIGLVKRTYPDSDIYITATKQEINELLEAGADMIAIDATKRKRPNGESLEKLVQYTKSKHVAIMADISTFEEGFNAEKLGFDCVSTTMSGYTPYSPQQPGPDFTLLEKLVTTLRIPVIAEGRIHSPELANQALQLGAFAVVVGSAITRPQDITKRYVQAIKDGKSNDNITFAFKKQNRWAY